MARRPTRTTTKPKTTSTATDKPEVETEVDTLSHYEDTWDIDAVRDETPEYLVPKMDHDAVSTPMFFNQLVMRDPDAAKIAKNEVKQALDPFAELPAKTQPNTPVEGALLTYEQGWFEKGLALGRLLHSTCLAPGEVTKIAITSFHRASRAQSQEAATQSDSVDASNDQTSAVHETQTAVSHDTQSGQSMQFGAASQSQASVSGGGLFVSGSGSTALSTSMGVGMSSSAAASDIAAQGSKNLSQRTVAASHAVRGRRAAQVREASENEAQSAATRVIANYNHMHALTMMFFEVLQVYQLKTRVVHAERVVFLPMVPLDFSQDLVRKYEGVLTPVLQNAGVTDARDMMNDFLGANLQLLDEKEQTQKAILENAIKGKGYPIPDGDRFVYPEYAGLPWILWRYEETLANYQAKLAAGDNSNEVTYNIKTCEEFLKDVGGAFSEFKEFRMRRQRMTRVVDRLEGLRSQASAAIYAQLDASLIQRLVKDKTFKGEGLEQLMDPRPLGVHGNYVAFRLPHADPKGDTAYAKSYEMDGDGAPTAQVVLPSGGVFGEAVLGQAVSAEKIDLTRFWNWKDSPIPILPPDMDPVSLATRARGASFDRVEMEKTITELLKPALAEGADLSGIVSKITENVRDMSGQAGLSAQTVAQITAAKEGAAKAGDLSVETLKANQAFGKALLDSDIVKAGFAAMMPEGEAATVLGGLIGATKGGDAKKPAAKAATKPKTKP
ncbi:hypothetical protein [Tateyamaria sp. SN3-11]|uniref:hypothetical protein n=1 Tax=Tateyamaria sp. SN3-11 TaxID=3092147 RepID=UPI0039E73CB9